MLAKGVANRTRIIKVLFRGGRYPRTNPATNPRTSPPDNIGSRHYVEGHSFIVPPILRHPPTSGSAKWRTNTFIRIRVSPCGGVWWVLFHIIIYRCVSFCVSSLSFEPHDLVQQAGKQIFNFYKNPAVLASPTRKNIHLRFAVRFDHVFPSIELEIQI